MYTHTHTHIHTIKGTSEIIVSFFQMQSKKPIPNCREWLTATESKGWDSDSYYRLFSLQAPPQTVATQFAL